MAHEIGTSVLDVRPLESPLALPSRSGYAHQLGRRSEVQRNASASKRSKCRGSQQHPIASAPLAPRRRGSNRAVASGFDFACESTLPGWDPCGIVIVMICPGMVKLNVEPGFDAEEGSEALPSRYSARAGPTMRSCHSRRTMRIGIDHQLSMGTRRREGRRLGSGLTLYVVVRHLYVVSHMYQGRAPPGGTVTCTRPAPGTFKVIVILVPGTKPGTASQSSLPVLTFQTRSLAHTHVVCAPLPAKHTPQQSMPMRKQTQGEQRQRTGRHGCGERGRRRAAISWAGEEQRL
jgi:hypothetical protein